MPKYFSFKPKTLVCEGEFDCLVLPAQSTRFPNDTWLSEPLRAQILKTLNLEFKMSSQPLGTGIMIYPELIAPFKRVLILQTGTQALSEHRILLQWIQALFAQLPPQNLDKILIVLPEDGLESEEVSTHFEHIISYFEAQLAPKSTFQTIAEDPEKRPMVDSVYFASNLVPPSRQQTLFQQSVALAQGIHRCCRVANLPGNLCTPYDLKEEAQSLAAQYPDQLTLKVHDEAALKQMKMGGLLAVSSGSQYPPYLIELHYSGCPSSPSLAPIALVGKGITFDSGGISIKPSAKMDRMKFDMCGAAAVLGILETLCQLKLPVRVVGLLAVCENMPDGASYRPGDVLTTYSGTTVEVLNTDAEGRLILADALAYAEQCLKPRVIIDMATLTGACVVALGEERSGLFCNDPALQSALVRASEEAKDGLWPMPLDAAYDEGIKSHIADWANCGDRGAGAVTAARFLSKFVTQTPWAHFDIAGTAYTSGKRGQATGRPIPTMVRYFMNLQG